MAAASPVCEPADLSLPAHRQAVLGLLDAYARDPMGGGEPLPADVRERLIPGLTGTPGAFCMLAWEDGEPAGLAVCFTGYSTFQAGRLVNIHDLVVAPGFRRRGIGRAVLAAVEAHARAMGCCRLTLEVRGDNTVAQHLYRSFGFVGGVTTPGDQYAFWKKPLT